MWFDRFFYQNFYQIFFKKISLKPIFFPVFMVPFIKRKKFPGRENLRKKKILIKN